MAKSSYLSNSAKILSVLAGMMLLANTLIAVGSFSGNANIARWGSSFSNFCFYVILVMGYIAFNGEAVGHKRNHDRKRKKVLGFFKLLLFFCFLFSYVKRIPEMAVMSLPADSVGGVVARLGMSLLATVGSYGFVFCALSLWYVVRDFGNMKLMLVQLVSFLISLCYNTFKFFNYAVGKYKITALREGFTAIFVDSDIMQVLCIFQFLFNLVMLVCITIYYGKKGDEEQKILDRNVKTLCKARNILKDEGYGIDTLEDDFLLIE